MVIWQRWDSNIGCSGTSSAIPVFLNRDFISLWYTKLIDSSKSNFEGILDREKGKRMREKRVERHN